jgi:predicted lipoprotein
MDHVIPGRLTVAFAAVLVLAGCAPATDDGPSQAPTTTTTTTTGSVRPACADLADKGQALLTEVGRYGTGKATGDQVRAAAAELSDSFDSAKTELGPEAQANLDEAGRALQEVLDALTAQPVDSAKLRAAAGEVVTALGDAAAVCTSSGTSTEPSSPTSTTDSVTTTS